LFTESRRAVASPIPEVPPVISAILFEFILFFEIIKQKYKNTGYPYYWKMR